MRVIDGDSHFREPFDWFDRAYPTLAAEIPPVSLVDMVLEVIIGDVMTSMPKGVNLRADDFLNPVLAARLRRKDKITELIRAGKDDEVKALIAETEADPELSPGFSGYEAAGHEGAARADWATERGIDVQIMLPTLGYMPYREAMKAGQRENAMAALRGYNTWAAEHVAGYTDRLIPVTLVDLSDLDWSLAEVRRMRELGSLVVQVRAEPAGDRSLSHPDLDVFWSTVEDLGMTVIFHVGGGRAPIDTRWINNGADPREFQVMARFTNHTVPELAVASLILGGVLERHPELNVLVAELGYEWVSSFGGKLDRTVSDTMLSSGGAPFDHLKLKPSEYFQRQVRVPVLPSATEAVADSMRTAPDGIFVFSSDWPHKEGSPHPVEVFEEQLMGDRDQTARERFYGTDLAAMVRV